jgi:hypothetical protein
MLFVSVLVWAVVSYSLMAMGLTFLPIWIVLLAIGSTFLAMLVQRLVDAASAIRELRNGRLF